MIYYQDIKLYPDIEIDIAFLRNKLYQKLHKAIFDLSASDIGISFPEMNKRLGCVIRIHSTQDKLNELQSLNWLGGLSGYCKVNEILPVPDKVKGHQTISRIRQRMNDAELKERIMYQKNQGILKTNDEVQAYAQQYKDEMKKRMDNPYLELQSTSTGNKYQLYIAFGELQNQSVEGEFNNFGLSKIATVPIF